MLPALVIKKKRKYIIKIHKGLILFCFIVIECGGQVSLSRFIVFFCHLTYNKHTWKTLASFWAVG